MGELPESVYKPLDPVKVCRAFYDGIGLPVDDVLRRAACTKGPARIRTPSRSTSTGRATSACWRTSCRAGSGGHQPARIGPCGVLEERRCGKGTVPGKEGDSPFSSPLPYILHTDAHPLCTEGVAMMFERFAQNVDWLTAMGAEVSEPTSSGWRRPAPAEPPVGLRPLLPGNVPPLKWRCMRIPSRI